MTEKGKKVLLGWFLAEPLRLAGRIVTVDTVKHTTTLKAPEPPTARSSPTRPKDKSRPSTNIHTSIPTLISAEIEETQAGGRNPSS